ncbi:MAG: hypothetical protein KA436_11910 [Oligoflexales bacterium]|nr:hypothetical protein [Oligoflexales bacterium]
MNGYELNCAWSVVRGLIKSRWGKITSNDLVVLAGNLEGLVGILQAVYGYSKLKAEEEYSQFKEALALVDLESRKSKMFGALILLCKVSLVFTAYTITNAVLERKFKQKYKVT